MKTRVFIVSPDGEKIELLNSDDPKIAEGAQLGAQALLNLLSDEMDLEDGYEIVKEQSYQNSDNNDNRYQISY